MELLSNVSTISGWITTKRIFEASDKDQMLYDPFARNEQRLEAEPDKTELRYNMTLGLSDTPKNLPIKYIYDSLGSKIFEAVTQEPGYYINHTECEILNSHVSDVAASISPRTLIELGSSSSEKARLECPRKKLKHIGCAYPDLVIQTVAGDFTDSIKLNIEKRPVLVACFGSTIGNQLPAERYRLLSAICSQMNHDDALLLGIDLVKDEQAMVSAYRDNQSALTAFFKNGLTVLNNELAANFDLDSFEHTTTWKPQLQRVENSLRARHQQTITLSNLKQTVTFEEDEQLLVGISYKFSQAGLRSELLECGFNMTRWWTDSQGRYAITLCHPHRAGR